MKILITGGNGFIAKNLFEQLSIRTFLKTLRGTRPLGETGEGSRRVSDGEGVSPSEVVSQRGLVPKQGSAAYTVLSCNSQELDLLNSAKVLDYIKNNKFDVVIHTATYDPAPKGSQKDPSKVLENNLAMFFNIARCKPHFGKMIYFGSGAEYDRQHWLPGMGEEFFDQHVPTDQYGFSKYIMTKYAQSNSDIYNLRILSVFGKYEDWRYRFISKACCQVILGMPITINRNVSYDFLYIDDLVKIVEYFINNTPQKSVYNACAGRTFNFKSLAEKVVKVSGKKLDIVVKADGPVNEYGGDNSALLSELKDFKFTPIDESIKNLYRWYESNRHIIDGNELSDCHSRGGGNPVLLS